MILHSIILFLLTISSNTRLFSMEEGHALHNPKSYIFKKRKSLEDIFNSKEYYKKEIYESDDYSALRVNASHENQYTYMTPGLWKANAGELFYKARKHNKNVFRYPGLFLIANGVVNRGDGLSHAFNWKTEAARNLKVLQNLLNHNNPVECWEAKCYSFWTVSSTLYALASGSRDAVELRAQLFISNEERNALLEKLKLIIVSTPLLSFNKMLNKRVNPLIESALLTAATVPAAFNLAQTAFCNYPIQLTNFFYPPLMNYFKSSIASCLSYYGVQYMTSIDEKKGEGLQLLYDLSKKEKRKINTTLLVTWQKEDKISDSVNPDDLVVLHNTFSNIVGIGSPYNDHLHDDLRQRRVMNWVRKEHNMPYYDIPALLEAGERHFNEIQPYHLAQAWVGLKEFTESSNYYII